MLFSDLGPFRPQSQGSRRGEGATQWWNCGKPLDLVKKRRSLGLQRSDASDMMRLQIQGVSALFAL